MIEKLISGGQTGADQGGLEAAEVLGIPTGGWAPKGWRTENGPAPWLGEKYGLEETLVTNYRHRTQLNIKYSNGTVLIGIPSAGSEETAIQAEIQQKPLFRIKLNDLSVSNHRQQVFLFREWLEENEIKVLNVAGNRESVSPGIEFMVKLFLISALSPSPL